MAENAQNSYLKSYFDTLIRLNSFQSTNFSLIFANFIKTRLIGYQIKSEVFQSIIRSFKLAKVELNSIK